MDLYGQKLAKMVHLMPCPSQKFKGKMVPWWFHVMEVPKSFKSPIKVLFFGQKAIIYAPK